MPGTTVIAGDSPPTLAPNLAGELGADLISSDVRTFPDGESKVTLSGTPSGRCVVVQSAHPPVDTNLMRALTLVSVAADRAGGVVAVIPYMGYARQDHEFLPGEVVTLKHVAKLFAGAGASRLVTVDIHSYRGLAHFGSMGANVSAVPDLARHFAGRELKDPLTVSPDAGGLGRAKAFADSMGTDWIALEKDRDRRTGEVSIRTRGVDVAGRDVILVDDMISTGGSVVKATEFLKGHGCGRVFAACTHALMVDGAASRISRAGVEEVVGANTVPGPEGIVDVSRAIAGAL